MSPGDDALTGPAAPADPTEERPTQLLPLLLERLQEGRPLTVLDVGQGVGETVSFFSQYRCRLHFAGLFEVMEQAGPPEEGADRYYDDLLVRALRFPPDTRFDICLLWDFLNYLPAPALRAFSAALRPYLHRDTVGHGFGSFQTSTQYVPGTGKGGAVAYGVAAPDRLTARPRAGGQGPGHPHSRRVLADSLTCFEIVRGTLLKQGTMELLLESR